MGTPIPPRKRQTVEQAGYLAEPPLHPKERGLPGFRDQEKTQMMNTINPAAKRATYRSRHINAMGQFIGISLVLLAAIAVIGTLAVLVLKFLVWLWGAL